ncbi:hypothetical protein BH09PAT1_BH09PAT1_7220 [soil metagenome]
MYWITGILGFLLMVSPYFFGYADNSAAFWTSGIVGGITLIVSSIEWVRMGTEKWEYWTAAALGIIAVSAPFIFGFSHITQALWITIGVGVLLTIFAASELFSDENIYA